MKLSSLFLIVLMILQSCRKDRHPNISTLQELINKGEVILIEKKDSISGQPIITFINDSIYIAKKVQYIDNETEITNEDEKMTTTYTTRNSIKLKNVLNGTTYFSDTIDSGVTIFTNDSSEIIIENFIYSPPHYTAKKVDNNNSTSIIQIPDIQNDNTLKELSEFDKSVYYDWTNTSRLGTIHEMFYYQLNEKKFKFTSQCYLVSQKKGYFYNPILGIMRLK